MSARELVVLGTASQAPTRYRNHNGYLLRWDGIDILFDPGEGTQRQMTLAGVSATRLRAICITHFHGDHCLGLPGILQRLALEGVTHPVAVVFPAAGAAFFHRLRRAAVFRDELLDIRPHPVDADGPVLELGRGLNLSAARLDHEPETYGWRVEEPGGRTMNPSQLRAAGVTGPAVGELQRRGALEIGGRRVFIDEVSQPRPGQSMAFVMDTGFCETAVELARGVDLVVSESTFAAADEELARRWRHLTAADAARVADSASARLLVLAHFSRRYPDVEPLLAEATSLFPSTLAASDLQRISFPSRRRLS